MVGGSGCYRRRGIGDWGSDQGTSRRTGLKGSRAVKDDAARGQRDRGNDAEQSHPLPEPFTGQTGPLESGHSQPRCIPRGDAGRDRKNHDHFARGRG